MSELQERDLVLFSFFLMFFLFLAPKVRISNNIGHMAQRRF